eukprot:5574814-Pyramimonas_sp.AAC.1
MAQETPPIAPDGRLVNASPSRAVPGQDINSAKRNVRDLIAFAEAVDESVRFDPQRQRGYGALCQRGGNRAPAGWLCERRD